jgi:hypothetical protein
MCGYADVRMCRCADGTAGPHPNASPDPHIRAFAYPHIYLGAFRYSQIPMNRNSVFGIQAAMSG